jgi:hypothetical protein
VRGGALMIQTISGIVCGDHLRFEQGPNKPKTKTWFVLNKHDNIHLGWIGWFARWRKYAFFPKTDTVYEEDCLKDIAQFCVIETHKHKFKKVFQNVAR